MANMDKRVSKLLERLKEKKLFFDEAVEYFKSKKIVLNREESLRLIEVATEQDVFCWLNLIAYLLEKAVSLDSGFLEVLVKVMEKTKRDMSQGILAQHLIQIGKSQPKLAIKIYQKMKALK